jgi:integrase
MATKITDKLIAKLSPPSNGYTITNDSETSGFGVRTTTNGSKSFVLRFRTRSGRSRTYTIGPAGDGGWTTAQARERAKDIKARIRSEGFDPLAELEDERGAPTVADLAERFLKEHAAKKRPSTRDAYERAFANYILPVLKHHKVAEVGYADIDGLHRKITAANGPYCANRTLAALSKAFALAIRWQWCAANPCNGIERNVEQKRKVYLAGDELARLTDALNKHHDQQVADVIRLILLTGCRRGEALSARWDQFNFANATWTKSSHETKQRRDHVTPLSNPVLQLLNDIREKAKTKSEFVFPGRHSGHRISISADWLQLRREAGLGSARIHDLRHSFASALASSGVSLQVVGALLGHSQISTTQRYAHLYDDSLRRAAETAASIIAPTRSAQIVKHPKSA